MAVTICSLRFARALLVAILYAPRKHVQNRRDSKPNSFDWCKLGFVYVIALQLGLTNVQTQPKTNEDSASCFVAVRNLVVRQMCVAVNDIESLAVSADCRN